VGPGRRALDRQRCWAVRSTLRAHTGHVCALGASARASPNSPPKSSTADAALRLAREQGFDNVTIEQISGSRRVPAHVLQLLSHQGIGGRATPLEIPDDLAADSFRSNS
jgi:hypothetical protein